MRVSTAATEPAETPLTGPPYPAWQSVDRPGSQRRRRVITVRVSRPARGPESIVGIPRRPRRAAAEKKTRLRNERGLTAVPAGTQNPLPARACGFKSHLRHSVSVGKKAGRGGASGRPVRLGGVAVRRFGRRTPRFQLQHHNAAASTRRSGAAARHRWPADHETPMAGFPAGTRALGFQRVCGISCSSRPNSSMSGSVHVRSKNDCVGA